MSELIPVIHMVDRNQVFENVDTCLANGIEKIFVINHGVSTPSLLCCVDDVIEAYPELWIGVNILGHPITTVIEQMKFDGYGGLWHDSSMTKELAKRRTFSGLLFSGLAFKYQPQPTDLKSACDEAKLYTDVATTSGLGTGQAADITKIQLIREYLEDFPMAIASGVSAKNVDNYKDLADYLLVASSITDIDEMIIPDKLKELREKL